MINLVAITAASILLGTLHGWMTGLGIWLIAISITPGE